MKQLPPLNDTIVIAVSRLVDDAQQKPSREPSHSDIEFCVTKCKLQAGDPKFQGQLVGKAKRVRGILNWAIDGPFDNGREFVVQLLCMIRGCGGFRPESPNYAGADAIADLLGAMRSEGFLLTTDGELHPAVLEPLSGAELTEALEGYVRRAQRCAEDAALIIGTGKDLLEATAAHVLRELWNDQNPPHNFPTLLGQAFTALGLKTTVDSPSQGEPPQCRLQRALYQAACAVNTLRNKEGVGHGHPWLPSVGVDEARHATQLMVVVSDLLLRGLKQKR